MLAEKQFKNKMLTTVLSGKQEHVVNTQHGWSGKGCCADTDKLSLVAP
jgi:hypothetical protein